MQDLHTENYKTFLKEIKEHILCSWAGRLNIDRMAILPQNDLLIQQNPYQFPSNFFFPQ